VEVRLLEQPLQSNAGEVQKSPERQLRGIRLWLARGAYFFLLGLIMTFFFIGLPGYLDTWRHAGIGVSVSQGTDGRLILSVSHGGDAASAGIQDGSTLTAINGTNISSAEEANRILTTGNAGESVRLTIMNKGAAPREYSVIFAGGFLKLLDRIHLSTRFLLIYNVIFSGLLALGVILSSLLVFLRRSKDWLVILVAFSMIAFASYFISPVGYGAYKLHVGLMNNLLYLIGMTSMVIVFFAYPSGHFEPRWTRWAAIFLFLPAVVDFLNMEFIGSTWVDFYLWVGFFALAAYSQVFRYRRVAKPTERQQTKQVVSGMVACFSIIAVLDLVSILVAPRLPYAQFILFSLLVKAGATLPVLALNLSFVLAIYRYRLWDTDLYINRSLVYGLVTLSLMVVWVVTTQVLNHASQQYFGKQAGWLGALLSSLQVAAIYKPVRRWVEKWVNNRFYKDRIEYSEALVELRPEMWTYLSPNDLGHILVTRIPTLLQSIHAALFIQERQGLVLTEVNNIHPSDAYKFHFTTDILKKMENGSILNIPEGVPFAILLPLTVSRLKTHDLIGILAIGPRTQGRGYSRDHVNDLTTLGRNAGIALYMLKSNERKGLKEIPSRTES
jgi:hypothetical protein